MKNTSFIHKTVKYIIAIIIMAVVGLIMLCLVYLIPCETIAQNAMKINDTGWKAGEYLIEGVESTYLNNYTEALMLNIASCKGEGNLFYRVAAAHSYTYEESDFNSFVRFCNHESGENLQQNSRYWNGYLIFLKPMLLVLSYQGIRVVNLIVSTAFLIIVLIKMAKSSASRFTLPFAISVISMAPVTMAFDMFYCGIYYILLISTFVLLWLIDLKSKKIDMLFLINGAACAFIDLISFPLVTLIYPLTIIELSNSGDTIPTRFKRMLTNAWAWVCGYIGLWGGKWIIASVFMKENIIREAIGKIIFRTSGADISGERVGRFEVLGVNLVDYFNMYTILWLVLLAMIFCFTIIIKRYRVVKIERQVFIIAIVLIVVPMVWIMFKTNHSFIHHWMTHRELSSSLFAFLAFLSLGIQRTENSLKREGK